MIKQGTVTVDDLIGVSSFRDASGKINSGLKFNIKQLEIGGVIVKDVEAISSDKIETPLLLGQSFLERFPSFTQDTKRGYLIINKN